LTTNADVRSEDRAKRGRGATKLEREVHLFFHRQAETTVLLGDRLTEEPELAHLLHDLVGDRIVFGDLRLERHETFTNEAADGVDELLEGAAVSDHERRDPSKCTDVATQPTVTVRCL
jgi:hypothetical protein